MLLVQDVPLPLAVLVVVAAVVVSAAVTVGGTLL
jgi:hypothetical protein